MASAYSDFGYVGHIIKKVSMQIYEPRLEKTRFFDLAKTKAQISLAVTAKLISAIVFATRIVQFLYFLNQKFPASSLLLRLYMLVCVGPGRKYGSRVFSRSSSYNK